MERKGLLIYSLTFLILVIAYFPVFIVLEKNMLTDRISDGLSSLLENECKVEVQFDSVKVFYGMFTSGWEAYREGERLYNGSLKKGIAFFNVPDSLVNQCPTRTYWWVSEQNAFVPMNQPYFGESDDWSAYAFPGFFSLIAIGVIGWIMIWILGRPRASS